MRCLAGKWNPHTKKLQNKILSHPHKKKPNQTKSTDRHRTRETTRKKHKECTQICASRKRICSDCSPQRSRIHNQYKTKAAEEGEKKKKQSSRKKTRQSSNSPAMAVFLLMELDARRVGYSSEERKRDKACESAERDEAVSRYFLLPRLIRRLVYVHPAVADIT